MRSNGKYLQHKHNPTAAHYHRDGFRFKLIQYPGKPGKQMNSIRYWAFSACRAQSEYGGRKSACGRRLVSDDFRSAGDPPSLGHQLARGIRETGHPPISGNVNRAPLTGNPVPILLAQQYMFVGQPNEAVDSIEKAVEERQGQVLYINQHPIYRSLRGNPRFQAIVVKLRL